ncbi:MAG: hypothetical protein OMM_03446 [Candidatus Magnetoglobus multicellularis str. Araruama]|uniref:YD repeat-containing protein n=1 Tax=Candidatus Magnetoglobus multicellularis str. Araruama TaxID=890399 RepID=A0A1V1P5J3_9BACT|nr:MAG: hypothetical protein OMM_03446 [Candidatus Magnetoglobus multicellularis str. Araruama]
MLGLTFSRFYNSRNNFRKRNMGYGWSHGYDIYIERHSDGASVLNGRLPIDAASSIIGIKIVLDLFKHVQTEISRPDMMRSQVAAILTHKWIADQLINNSITIHMGNSSLKYIKLPDESYNPPPNTTASLIYNSETNSYQLKDRFDKKYQFNSGDKIEYVLDSDGRKLIFNYENEKLKRVNNKIPDLTGQLYFDLSYDDNELLRSIEDNTDRIIHFEYKGDEMVSYTNAEKKHWRFKYDSNHQLLIIQDPEGYTQTDNTYDDSGRVISQKNANNQTYNFYYSKYKNTEEDPENNQTIYSFDNNRHLICTENAYGHRTKRKYDGQGHLTELCNPRNFTTTYIYDHYNNLRFVVDATNKQSEYIYDDFHRLAFFTNRSGHTTEYKYDTKHRLITTIDPEGNYYTKNYYQENGLLKATIDANNNKTTYYYDEYGFIDIVKMESADGFLQTAYDYDYNIRGYFEYLYEINPKLLKGKTIISPGKNQIKELIDYQRRYKFEYDKRKLLLKEFNPLNNDDTPKTKYLYDDNGNIRERHEFNIETGQYDITEYRHTPTNKIESIDYPDNTTVTIKYDSRDNIDYIIDPTGKNDYTYDKINRLKIFTRLFTIYYIYDEDGYTGQLTSIVYPGGFIGNKVKYTYDSLNRMKTITDWKNNLTEYHYDEIENEKDIKRTIYPNKSKMKYIYDKAGRLMALQNKKQDNSVIADYNYKFDSVGNIESVSYTDTIQFNFKSKTDFFKHNIANQIENSGFIYNIQGDIVNGLGYDFNYDHSHKLSTVSYSGHTSKYTYDGLGNRIKVEQDSVVKQYILNPETSVILAETSQGNIDRYYVYGDGLLYSIDIKGDTFFYHYDATGNTVAMTDKDSKIVNRYAYSPFGMEFFKDETVSNSFKFIGREGVIDDANGLYYMKARYYSPKLGRFISADPIGHNGGMNLYSYAGNNPINYSDPLGLWTIGIDFSVTLGAGKGATGGYTFALDSKLNYAILRHSGAGGVGGSAAGGAMQFQITNASKITDLTGGSVSTGGSVGPKIIEGTAEWIIMPNGYQGLNVGVGSSIGPSPVELHSMVEYSDMVWSNK